jgi:hypothetical protein
LSDPHSEDERTRAVAHLPGLDIEVTHRRSPHAEQLAIHLQAMPSFEAFGRAIESANPFAFWVEATRLVWLPWLAWNPWLNATHALLPPGKLEDAPPTIPEA